MYEDTPPVYPLVALKNMVVFPRTRMTLAIARENNPSRDLLGRSRRQKQPRRRQLREVPGADRHRRQDRRRRRGDEPQHPAADAHDQRSAGAARRPARGQKARARRGSERDRR